MSFSRKEVTPAPGGAQANDVDMYRVLPTRVRCWVTEF